MSWTTFTIDHVRAEAANARIEASVANDEHDLTTYFTAVSAGIVAEVRAAVASCDRNELDADTGKVPPEWVGFCSLKVLARFLSRPGLSEDGTTYSLTEDQRTEIERRTADLERVSKCELAVTKPATASTTPSVVARAAGIEMTGTTRRFTRTLTDGL
jgi:hypothetical protein